MFGREHFPKAGGFILASNHVSFVDPVVLGAVCPQKLHFLARHSLFKKPFFGWFLLQVGAFPVKRDSGDVGALKEAIRRIRAGGVLALFPEGTRTSGAVLSLKAGVAFLAEKAGVPVVPAYIKGSDRVLPKGARCIRLHKVQVRIGRPLHIKKGMPYQEFTHHVLESIKALGEL